jgi:hypothetical protein
MRSYGRSNVPVDQCSEFRGTFLDRGELNHLIDAELKWASAPAPAPVPAAAPPQHYQYPPQQYGKPYKKRKSFLEELFD